MTEDEGRQPAIIEPTGGGDKSVGRGCNLGMAAGCILGIALSIGVYVLADFELQGSFIGTVPWPQALDALAARSTDSNNVLILYLLICGAPLWLPVLGGIIAGLAGGAIGLGLSLKRRNTRK